MMHLGILERGKRGLKKERRALKVGESCRRPSTRRMHFLGTPTFAITTAPRQCPLWSETRPPSIVSRARVVLGGKAGRMENIFISGRAVSGAKKRALKASTKAIKVRPRTPISSEHHDLDPIYSRREKRLLIVMDYATRVR